MEVLNFRTAEKSDISDMHIVRTSVFENMLSDPSLITPSDYELFLFHRGKGWVCESGNRIVGFAVADLQEENIWALFVHPGYEGKGIARRLQKEMLDWYFTQRNKVWLGTAPGTRAEKFYRVSGWTESGMHGKELKFVLSRDEWINSQA